MKKLVVIPNVNKDKGFCVTDQVVTRLIDLGFDVYIGDSVGYLCDYYLGNAITNTMISPEEFIAKIKAVTKEDVVTVAKKLELEMIYFLTGKESEEK